MSADLITFPRRGGPPTGPGAAGGGGVDAVSSPWGSPITTHTAGPVDLALLVNGGVHHGRKVTALGCTVSCGQLGGISAGVRA